MNGSIAERICEVFGDDVRHLHGNLFRARRQSIKLANQGLTVKDGKLVYGNPRWFTNKDGQQEAKGIEKSKMEELRNSIQDEGMENPIRLRVIEGKKSHLEVINGERRFRCLEELCKRDVPCFHPETGEEVSASELYEWIDCRIEFMDDEMALRCALKPNETSEVIGDLANLNVVKTLRDSGFDDQDILKATGKSISWLRETEKIISLDEVCLENFQKEKINRKVALHLASIQDVEERISVLEKINESAMARHAEKIADAERKISKAIMDQECHETAAHIASEEGQQQEAEQHSEKAQKAKKRIENSLEEKNKLSEKGVSANSKDIENANKEDGISGKPLSHKKIQSIYLDLIDQILAAEGLDEDGNSLGINLEVLSSVYGVLCAIMAGNKEAIDVLAENCPLTIDEEELSEIEDSEEDSDEYSDEDNDDEDDDSDDEDDDSDEDESDIDDSYEPSLEDEKEFQEIEEFGEDE